jgi:mannosylglycoprotein endo-beta-mannosidase
MEEVLEVLRGFTKDKSLGPNGWTVELFLHFFNLVASDLLEAVEESHLYGVVNRSLNSMFIALIPKVNGPTTFGESLALCNLCYKIITKIIAKHIKPILSRTLSEEQFGFLKGRQIIDAIGTAQECINNIREKTLQVMILKIDLKKSYDCISWDFLILVLLQCGFGLLTTKWIMGCITTTTYAILINGELTEFFNSGRGLG